MTVMLWLFAGAVIVAAFALGASTANRWHDVRHRSQAILGVCFFAIGIVAVVDIANLQTRFGDQVACNTQLLGVLQRRGDARAQVDRSTHLAQLSLPPVLDDLRDGHLDDPQQITAARDAFQTAAEDRDKLDRMLSEPYPKCRR